MSDTYRRVMLPTGWYPDLRRLHPHRRDLENGSAELERLRERQNVPRWMAGLLLMSQLVLVPFTMLLMYAHGHHGGGATGWLVGATVLAIQAILFLLGFAMIVASLYRRLRRRSG